MLGPNERGSHTGCVLPLVNAEAIPGPKQLVTYPGAGHGLRECADEVRTLLEGWLTDLLLS